MFTSRNANPGKVERMRALGAEVISVGEAFDDARAASEAYAREHESVIALADGERLVFKHDWRERAPRRDQGMTARPVDQVRRHRFALGVFGVELGELFGELIFHAAQPAFLLSDILMKGITLQDGKVVGDTKN